MRVRFLKTAIYETEGFERGPRFEEGSVHDLREDIAERWIRRGLAEKAEPEVSSAPRRKRDAAGAESASPPQSASADSADAPGEAATVDPATAAGIPAA